MKLRPVFLVFGAAWLTSCAHPVFRIIVANESSAGTYVRVSAGEGFADFVYAVPPGSNGVTRQGSAPFEGEVELLRSDCGVISSTAVEAAGGDLVITFGVAEGPRVSPTQFQTRSTYSEVSECVRR